MRGENNIEKNDGVIRQWGDRGERRRVNTQNSLCEVRNMKNPFQYGVWSKVTCSAIVRRKLKIF